MYMINIIPIGSGSTGNCFYIEMGEYHFLVDMGIALKNVKRALEENDRTLNNLDAIFLTHGHHDHIKNASAICNNSDCKVYCNETILYNIKDANAEKVILEQDKQIELFKDFKVKMFSIPHDFVKTCGYIFEYKNEKLSYLTDCGVITDKILENLEKSDVVIIESNHDLEMLKNGPYPRVLQNRIKSEYGHLSNIQAAETILHLYEKGTRNFLLAHLSLQNNKPELALKCTKDKLKSDDVYIYVCKDQGCDLLSF